MTTSPIERRRLLAALIMISIVFMISSMDIYVPAMPLMRDYFHTDEFSMQLTLMISPFASAIVGIFFGRLSDIYGRLPLLFASFGFFLIGALGCCFAETLETFFLSRFIQAIGAGGLSILGIVIIADMFHGIDYARYMALYGALFPITFAVSPIVGAHMTEFFGWRSCFFLLFTGMSSITLLLKVLLPETLAKGDQTNQGGFKELFLKIKQHFLNREFVLMALGHGIPISLTGLFIANGSFIFIDGFAFTPTQYSFSQAIPIVLNFGAALVYRHYIPVLGLRGALCVGVMGLSAFVLAACGLVMNILPHSPVTILLIFCISNIAMPFVVATCATRAFEIFPADRGLSVSLVALSRNLSLSTIVPFAGLFFNGTIVPVYGAMIMVCLVVVSIIVAAMRRPLVFAGE